MDRNKLKELLVDFSILEVKRNHKILKSYGVLYPEHNSLGPIVDCSREAIEKEAIEFIEKKKIGGS